MPYKKRKNFKDPPPGHNLWRYIDFFKLKSMIDTESLFFCRADKFADPFEGSLPKKEVDNRKRYFQRVSQEENDKKYLKQNQNTSLFHQKLRKLILVNCWHHNTHESDAMWRLYLKSKDGVAIQTTPNSLKTSLKNNKSDFYMSKVRYLDYEKDIFYDKEEFPDPFYNALNPFIHKRMQFKHENEYRVFTEVPNRNGLEYDWDSKKYENGKIFKVDINSLINKIILHPHSTKEFKQKVRDLVQDKGFYFTVEKSEMKRKPQF